MFLTFLSSQVKDYHHLAIQDPFDEDRNVARHVTREGLEAIRDEFKRAHKIIENVGSIPGNHGVDLNLFAECRHTELDKRSKLFGPNPALAGHNVGQGTAAATGANASPSFGGHGPHGSRGGVGGGRGQGRGRSRGYGHG